VTSDQTINGLINVVAALVSLGVLGRFILWYMEKVVNRTMIRNEVLETRLEDLEAKLDAEQDNHRLCRQELADHKIDSTREMSELRGKIQVLEGLVNRPRRSTDEGITP
jgi:hypothetical protein